MSSTQQPEFYFKNIAQIKSWPSSKPLSLSSFHTQLKTPDPSHGFSSIDPPSFPTAQPLLTHLHPPPPAATRTIILLFRCLRMLSSFLLQGLCTSVSIHQEISFRVFVWFSLFLFIYPSRLGAFSEHPSISIYFSCISFLHGIYCHITPYYIVTCLWIFSISYSPSWGQRDYLLFPIWSATSRQDMAE